MIAGFAAGTSHHGHRETTASGLSNVDTNAAMTAESVLHVASLTKPMVAAAFVQAAPELVDSPLLELLPELQGRWQVSRELTARDVLSHRSGVTPDADRELLVPLSPGDDALARAAEAVVASPPKSPPRRVWEYNNGGYWLAGLALARLRGTTFENAMAEVLFRPAGMTSTGFEPGPGVSGHSHGRTMASGDWLAHAPSGGLCSNVIDVLAFAEYLIGQQALLAEVTSPAITSAFGTFYGLGWHLDSLLPDVAWHTGVSGSGYRAGLAMVAQHRFAAVALANDTEGMPEIEGFLLARVAEATGLHLPSAT